MRIDTDRILPVKEREYNYCINVPLFKGFKIIHSTASFAGPSLPADFPGRIFQPGKKLQISDFNIIKKVFSCA
jgi:hypothetical protein